MSENKKSLRPSARPMGVIHPQIIKQAIHGEDTSVKKFYSTSKNDDANTTRKIGDTWIDKDGFTWEQMDGWVRKVPKIGNLGIPTFCPNCGKFMKRKVDEKMWLIHQKCLDCVVKMEHEIRKNGNWEEYEKKKIIKNKIAYLNETLRQSNEYINNTLKQKIDFHDEDGKTETWDNDSYNVEKEFIEKQIIEIEDLIEKMKLVESGEKTEEEVFAETKEESNATA